MNRLLFQPIQVIEAVKIIQACCSSLPRLLRTSCYTNAAYFGPSN